MNKINKIKVNGTPYEVEDKEAVKTVTLTQEEYDALQTKDPSIFYVISDGQGGGGGMTSGEVQTMIDSSISGKADTSAVTESIATAVSGKQDTLVSGTNIKTINNESILGSGNITISGGGSGSSAVEVTQAEYDALVSGGTLDPSVLYIITDAVGGDLSNYMTSAQTMNAISAATSTKQDILSAGTGIDITDNTISVTGGSGGGKAVSGGTNISITTGETADTINCTLPIKKIQGYDSVIIGDSRNTVNGGANVAVGYKNSIIPKGGGSTPDHCFVGGEHNNVYNTNETAFGYYNNSVQNTSVGGGSGTTLFSIGNGTDDNARHNAFEIRKNGDIYLTKDGQDVKLQDQLGGGGGGGTTYSAGTNISIDSTNTINCTLPLSAGSKDYSVVEGQYCTASGYYSHAEGQHTTASTTSSHAAGSYTKTSNSYEFVIGRKNISNKSNNTFGDSGNTLFAVGNGGNYGMNPEHNAFEVRQNGDIYIADTNDTSTSNFYQKPMIKLQDHLGGGGGGGMTEDDELLLSTALTDLNDRKIDASEVKANYQKKGDYVTTSTLNTRLAEYETALDEQNVEEVTAYALNDLNSRFGGLSLVKITESEYAALTTKDENTLYVVVADPE